MQNARDVDLMRLALEEARHTKATGDIPVGAVVARDGVVVAQARNRREELSDPTAHAEVLALRAAAEKRQTWRLEDCTLYVTLEPCTMCAGSIVLARIGRLVFGAWNDEMGAVGTLWDVVRDRRLNHQPEVVSGLLADECGLLLRQFFQAQRDSG